ncbi:MAG TPA: glycoside hydrolase family 2 TIM barrel-domain containing protein [Acidobacteriaceae bacterium]|jgi:beta-galactosidase
MQRRDFLKVTGSVLASTALAGSTPGVLAQTNSAPGRLMLPINRNWRFAPRKLEGAERLGFDDSHMDRITIPHTNAKLPWHNFDDKEYEFVSTYRRRFRLPAEAAGKRVFVDFEGAMTASRVWINGTELGEYRGGYTPFSFELTAHLRPGENVLTVQLDSSERADIPPFGNEIDYMTFGGIYREVWLRVVPATWLDNVFAHPKDVLSAKPGLDVDCFLAGDPAELSRLSLEVDLRDGERVMATGKLARLAEGPAIEPPPPDTEIAGPAYASEETITDPMKFTVSLNGLEGIQLWELDKPHLYTVHARLMRDGRAFDTETRRIGFRHAEFTDHGFALNGKVVKLHGLDRHQTFPFVGQAMPARVQRQDAHVLRHKLHCNIVRTSHYPQSRHFLDCCDEIGLLALEEIPGWQHIGDEAWKLLSIDNVGRMIRRDWNHPSVILWGVRVNESHDDHSFYTRTNALAHSLDPTRQTGGIRYLYESEFLEDVFTMNDFGFPLRPPNHPRYLNTEFVGHTFPTKTTDDNERQREHTLRHARIHNQLASNPQYAGGIGWCAFDYNTHSNFGSGDRICYHGVTDIFREPKAAAGFYKSMCEPDEEVVLEPAFHWARGDESVGFTIAVICSNCDHLKIFIREGSTDQHPWKPLIEVDPDHAQFEHLKHPPFTFDVRKLKFGWGDMRIDGYVNGKQVISKTLSGRGVDSKFMLLGDDKSLVADGADSTRVVLRITDDFGNTRPFANDPVMFTLEGPAELIGDNPFALIGGTGAVWVRAREQAGTVVLTAKHPRLGKQSISITLSAAPAERA